MTIFDRKELDKLPKGSGIYIFYDKGNNILYVGKAKRLKYRVLQHEEHWKTAIRYNKFLDGIENRNLQVLSDKEFAELGWAHSISGSIQAIDQVFERVHKIETIEIPFHDIELKESELIYKFKPTYNNESGSNEYHGISDRYWRISQILINEIRRRNPDF